MVEPLTPNRTNRRRADSARPGSAQGDPAQLDSGQAEPGGGLLERAFGGRADRLARFDPRARVILAVLFATSVVSLQWLTTAFVALCVAGLVAWLGGVSLRRLRHLLPLELLMLVLLLTLPFSVPGAALLQLGPLAASAEGLGLALLILLKANAVVLILFGMVGALGPGPTVHALARLGMPAKLGQLLWLTLRQIELVGDEYRRMRLAMRARAFVPRSDRHSWNALGWLIGMLLVRSLARGQRVADAMRCRGFDGQLRLLQRFRWRQLDTLMLVGALSLLATLLLADLVLVKSSPLIL